MAEYRTLRMSFWNDPYIEAADPLRKLVYLYLITCPHTNNLGVLEVSTRRIAFEVGADADAVEKCLAAIAGDGKIQRDGCVIWLVSFIKHQTSTSFKIIQGLRGLLRSVTSDAIRSAITKAYPQIFSAKQPETGDTGSDGMDTVSKGHGYPIDTLSIPIAEEEREEEREEEKKEESSLSPLTPHATDAQQPEVPPMLSLEWQELRAYYDEHARTEGPMDGYGDYLAAKGAKAWPGQTAVYDAIDRWKASGQWDEDGVPRFAPGLGKFISRRLWNAHPTPKPKREPPRGHGGASQPPRATTQAQVISQSKDRIARDVAARRGIDVDAVLGRAAGIAGGNQAWASGQHTCLPVGERN